ncbi:hypothetical protein FQN60_002338 [Etheostoma spectabile]|uniref:Uncharacterized protein n=1 Tax=Etheostoma spectabile TaxID=54343 RepID=A0A5J5DDJ6_9PERO|nr:hypothetical protein FQN60_002338 [Etheostoma spectabile]
MARLASATEVGTKLPGGLQPEKKTHYLVGASADRAAVTTSPLGAGVLLKVLPERRGEGGELERKTESCRSECNTDTPLLFVLLYVPLPFGLFGSDLHAVQCGAGAAHTAGPEAALLRQGPVTQGQQLTAQLQVLPAQPWLKATLGVLSEQLAASADVLSSKLWKGRRAPTDVELHDDDEDDDDDDGDDDDSQCLGNKSDKKSATKQPQSPKEQPKKADQKGDDNKKQGGQPKGEKQ